MRNPSAIATGVLFCSVLLAPIAAANHPIRLARDPAVSPDGKRLAFSWNGDIWLAQTKGGLARRLTSSPAADTKPMFSADGKRVALISNRSGSSQVYVVDARGGAPEQLTFHSEGCSLEQWRKDALLISGSRDHYWRRAERFFLTKAAPRSREELLFDAYGSHGRLSPDGGKVLFMREGVRGYRKGYRGSQAGQIWIYNRASKEFKMLCNPDAGARYPMWHPNGKEFFFVSAQNGAFDIWRRNLKDGSEKQLTDFGDDDSVLMPAISANGKTIVFRRGFELYRISTERPGKPQKIKLIHRGDELQREVQHRSLSSATEAAFSSDGLEIAFIAGGDLWVMDTVLKEPKQVTSTPELENSPVFAPDGSSIWFSSDSGGKSDIWKAVRKNADEYWWRNEQFELTQITDDPEQESNLGWSPDGKTVAFIKGRGDLWLIGDDGKNARQLLKSWNAPDYDWAPDGKWLVYALSDNDFNRDIYIAPVDGSREPFNVSRHPDNDFGPAWSPDGKMIAFTGRRVGTETDIYFVLLQKSDDQTDARDRKLKEAIEKIKKVRKKPTPKAGGEKKDAEAKSPEDKKPKDNNSKSGQDDDKKKAAEDKKPADKPDAGKKKLPEVKIDFEDLALRVRRVSIADASEVGLFWSPDSKKLAFSASVNGKRGVYTISPPAELTAKLLSTTTGSNPKWIATGNQIVWLASGKPASLSATGQATSYAFTARQALNVPARNKVIFDLCWREMRDRWYDEAMNNRNWDAIRRKYATVAENAVDMESLGVVINLMLGELNGSHLGFYAGSRGRSSSSASSSQLAWQNTTAHFGVRFDNAFKGPGLKVKDVIRNSPASKVNSRILPGEIILAIDNQEVDPAKELTSILNGNLARDISLKIKGKDGKTRDIAIRPISYGAARSLLYEQWVYDAQQAVKKASQDRFAYAHIRGMNMTSFYRFERELYAIAAGKDGLIIDVRENGGGSTTDHLLTILTQPQHAITVPRGGGRGYPHDRRVYATWSKPIVVLCNQNSFSNAEIFSHAVKTLKRGKVVGVPTAGGVISTGGTQISDIGFLRLPFRGWFLLDGQDMEMHGCVPHHVLWPHPGDMPAGNDKQLTKAIEVMSEEVKTWKNRPQPKLIRASELRKSE